MNMNFMFLILVSLLGSHSYANCDLGKAARQTVKALAAIEDAKGITAYYGGLGEYDSEATFVNVQPVYGAIKDWYVVKLRNQNCHILSVELRGEKLPLSSNKAHFALVVSTLSFDSLKMASRLKNSKYT